MAKRLSAPALLVLWALVSLTTQGAVAQDLDAGGALRIAPAFVVDQYRAKAEAGDAGSQFRLGLLYEQGLVDGAPDFVSAAEWYGRAAAGGHGTAQFKRARMFEAGQGGAQSFSEAARLYTAAAQQGIAEAQFNLAILLENGVGVARNREDAVRWYEQAAFRGIVPAMRALGLLYLGGPEDEFSDDIEAWAWLSQAVEAGDGLAAATLADVEGRLGASQVEEARRLSGAYRQLRINP